MRRTAGTGLRAVAAVLVAAGAALAGAGPALAAGDGPVVVPVVDGIHPALPDDALLTVTPAGELAAAATSPVPLAVVAPDGRDFLRISAGGVDLDAAHPFTYESSTPPGVTTRLPDGVRPGSPERWVHVSDAASWHWYDPRTRPAAVRAPAGGRDGVSEVLATWSVPLRDGGTPITVDGRLELRPGTGALRTAADPAPDGLGVLVSPGEPPSVVLQAPSGTPVTVLGADGEPFLRRTPAGGWEADPASRTYRLGLLRAGVPVPAGTGWIPYGDTGPVNWADDRLTPPQPAVDAARTGGVPADVLRWRIPVLLGDRRVALTGTVRYQPPPGAAGAAGSSLPLAGLAAAVLLLGGGLVALTRRQRRVGTRAPGPGPGGAGPTDAGPTDAGRPAPPGSPGHTDPPGSPGTAPTGTAPTGAGSPGPDSPTGPAPAREGAPLR